MDTVTDAPTGEALAAVLKKAPRKPRPSEIAAKAAKKKKPKAKKAKKPAAKPKTAKRPKVKTMAANARSERLDMRLTKAEKARVLGKATKLRRTVTSVVIEAIEKIK